MREILSVMSGGKNLDDFRTLGSHVLLVLAGVRRKLSKASNNSAK